MKKTKNTTKVNDTVLANRPTLLGELRDYLFCVVGGLIYAAAINLFVLPSGLYIGNLTGIATIIQELLGLVIPKVQDLTGVLFLLLNLPLLIISFRSINRKFFFKTILTIIVESIALQVIPVTPLIPGVTDMLTICLIGGILAGFGAGLPLRSGGSGGGTDILGVYLSLKNKDFSVGRVSLMISLAVYSYALFKYLPEIMVYSVIFTLIYSFVIDRIHYMNVKISVTIITKNREILPFITEELTRGATYWNGAGAFSDTNVLVINTVVSKYEMIRLRKGVLDRDPQAFLIETNKVNVTGYFPSHFY